MRIAEERVRWLAVTEPYQPGLFYARELLAVLSISATPVLLGNIDGYVDLDPQGPSTSTWSAAVNAARKGTDRSSTCGTGGGSCRAAFTAALAHRLLVTC